MKAWIQSTDGAVTGGHLMFGASELPSISYDNFKVRGSLATADYDEWKSFTTALNEVCQYALENELVSVLQSIDFTVSPHCASYEISRLPNRKTGEWFRACIVSQ